MSFVASIVRYGVAGIFVIAAFAKIARPGQMHSLVSPYMRVRPTYATVLAGGLIAVEALVAVALCVNGLARGALVAAAVLFAVFAAMTARAVRHSGHVSCNCLGAGVDLVHDEWAVVINCGVACACAVVAAAAPRAGQGQFTVSDWIVCIAGAGTVAVYYWLVIYVRSVTKQEVRASKELIIDAA
jgi:hypothetical protein